jgi:RimJ/RimL family protein N-acetyltransferase
MFFKQELKTRNLCLRQIEADDFEALYQAASDPLIWELHPDRNRYKRERFEIYFQTGLAAPAFYKILDSQTLEVIGSTRFYGLQEEQKRIELGYSFLIRKKWGGNTNLEVKRALLQEAFQFVDSVIFTVGVNNFRSQRAMEKIGGGRVLRPELLKLSGDLSAAVVYEIHKDQMPEIERIFSAQTIDP